MPPRTTRWKLEGHTQGKHEVLKQYLAAWWPIMASTNERVLFVDGFAGPGKYAGGEPGSPLIALHSLIDRKPDERMKAEVNFMFIEEDADRASHLRELLEDERDAIPTELNIRWSVHAAKFDATLRSALDAIDQQNSVPAPAFVMIDPFGVSDTPMSVISRILGNPKPEVYISFMYNHINRFRGSAGFEPHLNTLFGCEDWKDGIDLPESDERKKFFYDLYSQQLKVHGAEHVLRFELYEGGRLEYAIFFATKSLDGSDKMKQAIWKVDPFGDYKFQGARSGQQAFDGGFVDFSSLEREIVSEFGRDRWIAIEDIERFVMSDKTDFHSGHLKGKTLSPMERRGELQARRSPGRRASGFTEGTKVRFVVPEGRQDQLL